MTEIRILQSVGGVDFSWTPGEVVDLPADEAALWVDGVRAEYVTPPADKAKPEDKPEATDRGGDRETTVTPRRRATKRNR